MKTSNQESDTNPYITFSTNLLTNPRASFFQTLRLRQVGNINIARLLVLHKFLNHLGPILKCCPQ